MKKKKNPYNLIILGFRIVNNLIVLFYIYINVVYAIGCLELELFGCDSEVFLTPAEILQ